MTRYLTPEHIKTAEENGIPKKLAEHRFYYRDWTLERAITQPIKRPIEDAWEKWKDKAVVSKMTYRRRVKKLGWTQEDAALTPPYWKSPLKPKKETTDREETGAIYALYRDDEYIHSGTVDELAELRGVDRKTIFHYQTPTYRKRAKSGLRLVKLEED